MISKLKYRRLSSLLSRTYIPFVRRCVSSVDDTIHTCVLFLRFSRYRRQARGDIFLSAYQIRCPPEYYCCNPLSTGSRTSAYLCMRPQRKIEQNNSGVMSNFPSFCPDDSFSFKVDTPQLSKGFIPLTNFLSLVQSR